MWENLLELAGNFAYNCARERAFIFACEKGYFAVTKKGALILT